MEIKCPNCGAGIDSDGKFCKYCGVKLPDDTQRVEVSGTIEHNVNIRKERVNQTRIAKAKIKAKAEVDKAEKEALRLKNLAELEKERRETQKHDDKVGLILFAGVAVFIILIWFFA